MHYLGRIDLDNLNAEKSYSAHGAYTASKLANLLFAYELQRRFQSFELEAISTASHPGFTTTNLQRHSAFYRVLATLAAMHPEKGALSTLCAATAAGVEGGSYFGPRGLLEVWGYPKQVRSSKRSHDRALAERLWTVSEELTGVRYRGPGEAA